jgi:glutathione S-transferase
MLRIWGRINSVNVKKPVGAGGRRAVRAHRRRPPVRHRRIRVPRHEATAGAGLDDEGFVLWESNAMVRYLARRYGLGTLCPRDERACADADRWMDWCATTLAGSFRNVFWGMVRTAPEKRDTKAIEESRLATAALLELPEAVLAQRPYIAGESFSMGDIPLGCYVHLWLAMPIERPAHPHSAPGMRRLSARPAFQKAVNTPLS